MSRLRILPSVTLHRRRNIGSEQIRSDEMFFLALFMALGSRLRSGIIVVTVSSVIGVIVGSIAGFYGGIVDRILSGYVFNVFLAFPGLLLAIALVAFLGRRTRQTHTRPLRDRLGRLRPRDARTGSESYGSTILFRPLAHWVPAVFASSKRTSCQMRSSR